MRRPLTVLVFCLAAGCGLGTGCKNVCQKFADHLEDCRVEYCESHARNPVCTERYEGRGDYGGDCPSHLHHVMEAHLEEACDDLAREMGWEALDRLTDGPTDE